jgi:hypothetical protein
MKSWNINLNDPTGSKKIQEIFEKRVKQLMRVASIEFWRQVIIATPVDTGYVRYGWFISSHTPSAYLPPDGQEKYQTPKQQDHQDIKDYGLDDKLYINNNVPYVGRLNEGYSKQAPANFVEKAAARVQNAIAAKAKSIK